MKKLTTKLTLSKTTVASLDKQEMTAVKGGLTYSLSWSSRCYMSKNMTASNVYECGLMYNG